MTDPTNTQPTAPSAEAIEALRELEAKATPGPWKWAVGEGDPQIEGNLEYPESSPVLVARGCGNKKASEAGVLGCMPEKLGDPLRACPMHPCGIDRELIVALRNAAPALLATVEAQRKEIERLNSGWQECLDALAIARNTLAAGADERDALRSTVQQRTEQRDALKAEVERLRAALTPSGETKAAYMGEFEVVFKQWLGDDESECTTHISVPWTTIKDIMAAISKRAALRGEEAPRE